MEAIIFSSKQDLHALNNQLNGKISLYEKDTVNYLGVELAELKEASFFLAEWLHRVYAGRTIREGLRTSFDFLSQDEIYGVKQLADQRLEQEKAEFIQNIQKNLLRFTEISNKINLEGFWRFAMQDYRDEVLELLEESLDDYLAEQDYKEFLELLRYFIELEQSQMKELSVIALPDNTYRIYDEKHIDITDECTKLFCDEFIDAEQEDTEQQNDLLISLLVILLPEKIYLYGTKYVKNKNFITTLETVFAGRIECTEEIADL